jgi:hypothetical protein
MPRLNPASERNTHMVTGARLVEIHPDVGLIGDIAEGDRPHTGDPFEQAKAVRPSQ